MVVVVVVAVLVAVTATAAIAVTQREHTSLRGVGAFVLEDTCDTATSVGDVCRRTQFLGLQGALRRPGGDPAHVDAVVLDRTELRHDGAELIVTSETHAFGAATVVVDRALNTALLTASLDGTRCMEGSCEGVPVTIDAQFAAITRPLTLHELDHSAGGRITGIDSTRLRFRGAAATVTVSGEVVVPNFSAIIASQVQNLRICQPVCATPPSTAAGGSPPEVPAP